MGRKKGAEITVVEKYRRSTGGSLKQTTVRAPTFVQHDPGAEKLMAYRRPLFIASSAMHHYMALRNGLSPVHPSPAEAVRIMILNTSQYLRQPDFGAIIPVRSDIARAMLTQTDTMGAMAQSAGPEGTGETTEPDTGKQGGRSVFRKAWDMIWKRRF